MSFVPVIRWEEVLYCLLRGWYMELLGIPALHSHRMQVYQLDRVAVITLS